MTLKYFGCLLPATRRIQEFAGWTLAMPLLAACGDLAPSGAATTSAAAVDAAVDAAPEVPIDAAPNPVIDAGPRRCEVAEEASGTVRTVVDANMQALAFSVRDECGGYDVGTASAVEHCSTAGCGAGTTTMARADTLAVGLVDGTGCTLREAPVLRDAQQNSSNVTAVVAASANCPNLPATDNAGAHTYRLSALRTVSYQLQLYTNSPTFVAPAGRPNAELGVLPLGGVVGLVVPQEGRYSPPALLWERDPLTPAAALSPYTSYRVAVRRAGNFYVTWTRPPSIHAEGGFCQVRIGSRDSVSFTCGRPPAGTSDYDWVAPITAVVPGKSNLFVFRGGRFSACSYDRLPCIDETAPLPTVDADGYPTAAAATAYAAHERIYVPTPTPSGAEIRFVQCAEADLRLGICVWAPVGPTFPADARVVAEDAYAIYVATGGPNAVPPSPLTVTSLRK